MSIQRFLLVSAIGSSIFRGFSAFGARYDVCTLETFKITAYYSPQPDQSFYVKGSFEEDKILNGEGTHGASGKEVFDGMIAAPAAYAFGTRIYIPGRGIGQIEDRGGAIVTAEEGDTPYDRLDIWAGEGEEGLEAALRFGVRYIDAYVCRRGVGGSQLGFDFTDIPLGKLPPASLREISLRPGQTSRRTPILQTYLMKLGFMPVGETTTLYDAATKRAVCTYQQRVMGFSPKSQRCGWFGEKTRNSLKTSLEALGASSPPAQPQQPAESVETDTSSAPIDEKLISSRFFAPGGELAEYVFTAPLQPGDTLKEVRILQRKLQRLGYYPAQHEISGVYDETTIRALYAFQLDQKLISDHDDPAVYGYFGPKTRVALNTIS